MYHYYIVWVHKSSNNLNITITCTLYQCIIFWQMYYRDVMSAPVVISYLIIGTFEANVDLLIRTMVILVLIVLSHRLCLLLITYKQNVYYHHWYDNTVIDKLKLHEDTMYEFINYQLHDCTNCKIIIYM